MLPEATLYFRLKPQHKTMRQNIWCILGEKKKLYYLLPACQSVSPLDIFIHLFFHLVVFKRPFPTNCDWLFSSTSIRGISSGGCLVGEGIFHRVCFCFFISSFGFKYIFHFIYIYIIFWPAAGKWPEDYESFSTPSPPHSHIRIFFCINRKY